MDYSWTDLFSNALEEVDGIVKFKDDFEVSHRYRNWYTVKEIHAGGRTVELFWPKRGNILVQVSGGADSASMLYSIAKIAKEEQNPDRKIFPVTYKRNKPHNLISAPNVIRWIEANTGYKFAEHIIIDEGPEDENWPSRIVDRLRKLKHRINVTLEIDAQTALPGFPGEIPLEAQKDLGNSIHGIRQRAMSITDRLMDLGDEAVIYYITKPLWLVDKSFVAAIFHENNILDLLPYTRSCESLPEHNENFKYTCLTSEDLISRDTTCWWCVERRWAFRKYENANYSDFIQEYNP
jgi:hypothetical protein